MEDVEVWKSRALAAEAALKEAERRAERAEKMHAEAFRIGIQHQEAAQAAEADCLRLGEEIAALRNDLAGARRDALEEAAKVCDTISFVKTTPQKQIGARMCAAKLRALQTKDTTP